MHSRFGVQRLSAGEGKGAAGVRGESGVGHGSRPEAGHGGALGPRDSHANGHGCWVCWDEHTGKVGAFVSITTTDNGD